MATGKGTSNLCRMGYNMNYDKNEWVELVDRLMVSYESLEQALGRKRAEQIYEECALLSKLSQSSKAGAVAHHAAIRAWRKGIMAELDREGYYVERRADEIVPWGLG